MKTYDPTGDRDRVLLACIAHAADAHGSWLPRGVYDHHYHASAYGLPFDSTTISGGDAARLRRMIREGLLAQRYEADDREFNYLVPTPAGRERLVEIDRPIKRPRTQTNP